MEMCCTATEFDVASRSNPAGVARFFNGLRRNVKEHSEDKNARGNSWGNRKKMSHLDAEIFQLFAPGFARLLTYPNAIGS